MSYEPQVKSLEEAEVHIRSLTARVQELERVVRAEQDFRDTFVNTPTWKRWLFILDGWSGHKIVEKPRWRPWRRWYIS
jgi:hypothetical protein